MILLSRPPIQGARVIGKCAALVAMITLVSVEPKKQVKALITWVTEARFPSFKANWKLHSVMDTDTGQTFSQVELL